MIAGVDSIDIGDTVCDPAAPEAAAAHPRRSAHDPRALLREHLALLRPRGPLRDQPPDRRSAAPRGARQRLDPRSTATEAADIFEVAGRGELQIAILIETHAARGLRVRRVAARDHPARGRRRAVRAGRGRRRRDPRALRRRGDGEARGAQGPPAWRWSSATGASALCFVVPSRGLFGYRSEFLTDTRGEGVLHRTVRGYEPLAGDLPRRGRRRHRGERGRARPRPTASSASRSARRCSSAPASPVYEGQVVGENRRANDMNVNVVRAKKLTNIRAAGQATRTTILTPPREVTIECGARVDRGRRAARGDAAIAAPAQAHPVRQLPQALSPLRARGRRNPTSSCS